MNFVEELEEIVETFQKALMFKDVEIGSEYDYVMDKFNVFMVKTYDFRDCPYLVDEGYVDFLFEQEEREEIIRSMVISKKGVQSIASEALLRTRIGVPHLVGNCLTDLKRFVRDFEIEAKTNILKERLNVSEVLDGYKIYSGFPRPILTFRCIRDMDLIDFAGMIRDIESQNSARLVTPITEDAGGISSSEYPSDGGWYAIPEDIPFFEQ